ncbi:MAG: TcpD family membrane protein [Candidatus Alkaliphilus sp. MAG34]
MMNNVKGFVKRNKMKFYTAFSASVITLAMQTIVFADDNWGVNIKNWILEQASALALAAVVIILIPMIMKKMWAAMIGTLIGAAVALYFINNPDALVTIGGTIKKIIFG